MATMTSNSIKKDIMNYSALMNHFLFRVNNIPAVKHHAGLVTRGVPDILGITRNGIPIGVEIKAGSDKMSPFQKDFKERWERLGGLYVEARDIQDFIEFERSNIIL